MGRRIIGELVIYGAFLPGIVENVLEMFSLRELTSEKYPVKEVMFLPLFTGVLSRDWTAA